MLNRLLRIMLIPPLSIAVTVMNIIGLTDFDFLVTITVKVIAAIVILGIPVIVMKMLLFSK